jgi:hypothetical protein
MADQDLVQAWQPFFMALAGASAALAGLVFIAVSLHPQITLAHPLMRVSAFVAASGFLLGLAWALIMLLPARTAPIGSLLLLAEGSGGGAFKVYQQIKVRTLGLNIARVVLGDPILLAPVVAGVTGLLRPQSPFPFTLLAIATSVGFFVLFSQCWTLWSTSVQHSDGPHRSEPRSGRVHGQCAVGELADAASRTPCLSSPETRLRPR